MIAFEPFTRKDYMAVKRENELIFHPFWRVPTILDEDIWGLGAASKSGLSVSEDEGHIYIEAQLPEIKSDDIDISFEKGVLWIRGGKKEQEEDKKRWYYRKASTSFSYQVQVPGRIDEKNEPEATCKDGVIKISFIKEPKESQMKKIPIK
jgi:HSP20 family protein